MSEGWAPVAGSLQAPTLQALEELADMRRIALEQLAAGTFKGAADDDGTDEDGEHPAAPHEHRNAGVA